MSEGAEVGGQVPKGSPESENPLPAHDAPGKAAPALGLTSGEGLVVTSSGSFFRSAWERMGVVFCTKVRMQCLPLSVHSGTLFGPHCPGQWGRKPGPPPYYCKPPFSLGNPKNTETLTLRKLQDSVINQATERLD